MMTITDTHTHLYSEEFNNDRSEMIHRALQLGITRFFVPAIDSNYTEQMLLLQKKFPSNIFLMNGLHPCSVRENYQEELSHIEQLMKKYHFYAIGETGIDLYWDKTFFKEQQEAFRWQIRLAKENKLPIVIHCRDAFDEVFEILEEEKSPLLQGIFHCFTGTEHQAWLAISYGMKLGIGGVVTFKNGKIDQFLQNIPLEHIVLETDAPYLAPVPHRGKRNESAYLTYIIERLSNIYKLPETTIASVTTNNSKKVFGV